MPGRPKPIEANALWFVWLAAALELTWSGFVWQLEYLKVHGPRLYRAFPVLLVAVPVAFALWQRIRRRGLWRYEFAMLAVFPVVIALIYEPRATAVTLWVVLACFAGGRFLLRRIGLETACVTEAIAVGFGVLFCVLFGLGLLGLYYGWVFLLLLAAPVIVFRADLAALWPAIRACDAAWRKTEDASSPLGALLIASAVIFAVFTTMLVLAPSLGFDALATHLPAAHYYAAIHAVRPVPNIDYSYHPQGVESLMALGYVLAGQPAAQMLPPVFYVFSLLLAFVIARKCGAGRLASMAGVVFVVASPAFHWTGSVVKNDFALAFFLLAAFLCYLRWRDSGNFRWIQLGVFLLAMGGGVKNIIAYALPGYALLFGRAAWREPRRVRAYASLIAIFLVFGLFWQIRTLVLTGSPLPPGLVGQAGHALRGADRMRHYLFVPYYIFFHSNWYFDDVLQDPLGPTLVFFIPAWLVTRKQSLNYGERAALLVAVLYILCWCWAPSLQALRYVAAAVVLLATLTAGRTVLFYSNSGPIVRASIFAAITWCLVFTVIGCTILELNAAQMLLFTRRIDQQEYLRQALSSYRSLEFLRTQWKPGNRVLGVGVCSLEYSPDPLRFDCVEPDASKIRSGFERRSYDFVILPTGPLEQEIMGAQATPLYRDVNYAVYAAPGNRATIGIRKEFVKIHVRSHPAVPVAGRRLRAGIIRRSFCRA